MHRLLSRSAVLVTVGAGVLAATVLPALADTTPVSQSQGYFLSGSVGGTDLATLADLTSAAAVNTGGAAVTASNPLSATVLGQLTIPVGPVSLPIGTATGLQLGVLNQYATAAPDGSAAASSGAIADNGAIDANGTAGTAGTASLDLGGLASSAGLPTALSGLLTSLGDVKLTAGALAGRATQAVFTAAGAPGAQTGSYAIGGLTVDVSAAPALTGLTTQLTDAAGALLTSVTALLPPNPALSVSLPPASDVLASLTTISGPGFSADLITGSLHIDLAALLAANGRDINALPPDTDLTQYLVQALPGISTAITTALTNAGAAFATELGKITIDVLGATLPLSSFVTGFDTLSATLATTLGTLGSTLGTGLGTLGSALAQLLTVTANVQATAAGTFSETALQLALLPNGVPGGAATAAALVLGLASASVGPGTPLVVAPTPTPTPTTTGITQLANTGPGAGLGGLALGVWSLVAGMAVLVATTTTVRRRRSGSHRAA